MRLSPALSLIFVGLASVEWKGLPPGKQTAAAHGLLADRECSTCAECWGAGSVICSLYNCSKLPLVNSAVGVDVCSPRLEQLTFV
jgi:hypothetical protein